MVQVSSDTACGFGEMWGFIASCTPAPFQLPWPRTGALELVEKGPQPPTLHMLKYKPFKGRTSVLSYFIVTNPALFPLLW